MGLQAELKNCLGISSSIEYTEKLSRRACLYRCFAFREASSCLVKVVTATDTCFTVKAEHTQDGLMCQKAANDFNLVLCFWTDENVYKIER